MNQIFRLAPALLVLATLCLGSMAGHAEPTSHTQPAKAAASQSATVNINTASAEEIASSLKGIGLKKAQAIVAWREAHGKFTSEQGLLDVKGIGESTLAKNAGLISVQ